MIDHAMREIRITVRWPNIGIIFTTLLSVGNRYANLVTRQKHRPQSACVFFMPWDLEWIYQGV